MLALRDLGAPLRDLERRVAIVAPRRERALRVRDEPRLTFRAKQFEIVPRELRGDRGGSRLTIELGAKRGYRLPLAAGARDRRFLYFSVRLRARMREEHAQQSVGWLGWLRRPAVLTAAAALLAIGVGMLGGAHRKSVNGMDSARNIQPAATMTSAAVGDLQYLDNHADLFTDFDAALDDDQTETN